MRRILASALNRLVLPLSSQTVRNSVRLLGWGHTFRYYILFQKLLRHNNHVPWPVHFSSVILHPERIVRRDETQFPGDSIGQYIQATNGIVFGKNVWLGPGVKIISANHNLDNYFKAQHAEPIEIGDNCWLSANCVILPAVKLGNHVVVGAGAVVTQSFPDNCVLGGVPARIIKRLGPYNGIDNMPTSVREPEDAA